MSKSLGNIVSTNTLLKEYGSEPTRLYFAFEGPEDFDVSFDA